MLKATHKCLGYCNRIVVAEKFAVTIPEGLSSAEGKTNFLLQLIFQLLLVCVLGSLCGLLSNAGE